VLSLISDFDEVTPLHPHTLAAVAAGLQPATVYDAIIRDPKSFAPGSLLACKDFWDRVILQPGCRHRQFCLDTLGDVDLASFFVPFTGNYKGDVFVQEPLPPPREFKNYGIDGVVVSTGQSADDWIRDKLQLLLQQGFVREWGSDVRDQGDRPYLVSPLTVEPDKPRLITAMVFLNHWTAVPDFHAGLLNYASEVPGTFGRNPYMVDTDKHSHYDHYSWNYASQKYLGIAHGGKYYVLLAGGFGWKGWPFIANEHRFHKDCFLRSLGCDVLGFFDDNLQGGRRRPAGAGDSDEDWRRSFTGRASANLPVALLRAHECAFLQIMISTLCGYFFSLKKCHWLPRLSLVWVGVGICAQRELFHSVPRKIARMRVLCTEVVAAWYSDQPRVSARLLQSLAGRTMCQAVSCPAVRVYSKYMFAVLNQHCRAGEYDFLVPSARVPVTALLLRAVQVLLRLPLSAFQHPWLSTKHSVCWSVSDASDAQWSFSLSLSSPLSHAALAAEAPVLSQPHLPLAAAPRPTSEQLIQRHQAALPEDLVAAGSFPSALLARSIGFKELYAIVAGLWSLIFTYGARAVMGRRISPYIDNQGDFYILLKGGSTTQELNELMEILFWMKVHFKFELGVPAWLATNLNPFMDAYSRNPPSVDAELDGEIFELLALKWGPFDMDLMATDATAKCPAFCSRFACLGASAVNVMAQDLSQIFGYAFPNREMIGPLLQHLHASAARAVVVAPSAGGWWRALVVQACVDSCSVHMGSGIWVRERTRHGLVACSAYDGPHSAYLLDFRPRRLLR
jgi:hypothetical protein